jgi:hypothetical protein
MLRNRYGLTAALLVCTSALAAQAQLPSTTLSALQPPGGKIGATFDVNVTLATDAEEADRLVFSHPGITAKPKTEPSVLFPGKDQPIPGKYIVTIGADVPPGVYDVRLAGPMGVSNPRGFAVEQWNEAVEVPGNSTAEKAQAIEFNSVVSGVAEANAEDWYKFPAKKGTRLLVDVVAQRIDSKTDATLVVYDSQLRELARSRDANRRDPFVDVVIPADGDYYAKVYDFTFAGGVDYFYRLAVHNGPYIDFVFPPVVRAGEKNKLTVYGRNLPGGATSDVMANGRPLDKLEVVLDVPKDEPTDRRAIPSLVRAAEGLIDGREYRLKTSGGKSNAVFLGYASAPIVVEQEPNAAADKAQKVTVPCEYVGQFNPRGDIDGVQFEAKKGDEVAVEVISQRSGLSTDPVLLVQRADVKDGKTEWKDVQEVDDDARNIGQTAFNSSTGDPYYKLTAPQDGTYRVSVRDLYGDSRGDPRLIYRLTLRKPQPDFRLIALPVTIAKGANNNSGQGYKPWGTLIRSGEIGTVTVMAARQDGFDGPIRVKIEGLPAGVTASEAVLGSKQDLVPLAIVVPEKTAPWQGTVRVVGTAEVDGKPVKHEARATSILATGANNRSAEARVTQELMLAVGGTDVLPYAVELGDGKVVSGEQGAKVVIPVKITRRGDFKEPLLLTPLGLPPYAKVAQATFNPADKNPSITVELDKAAPVGEISFALTGVVPKFTYNRDKSAVETVNKVKADAAKAAAAMTEVATKAKAAAAAAPKEKKPDADKLAAEAAEKAKLADAANKAIAARADAVVKAGTAKAVTNVPIISTVVTLKVTAPAPKEDPKKPVAKK